MDAQKATPQVNIEFLQVSPDALMRLSAVSAETDVPEIELYGWMLRFWMNAVAKLNNDRSDPSRVAQATLQRVLQALEKQFGKDAQHVLSGLIEQGFFQETGDTDGTPKLRICGMSRYFDLQERREKAIENGRKGGVASAKSRISQGANEAKQPFKGSSSDPSSDPSRVARADASSKLDVDVDVDVDVEKQHSVVDSKKPESPPAAPVWEKPKKQKAPKKEKPAKPITAGWNELVSRLGAIYAWTRGQRYVFADTFELARLKALVDELDKTDDRIQVEQVWAAGLAINSKFVQIHTIAKLCERFNALTVNPEVLDWLGEHWGEVKELLAPQNQPFDGHSQQEVSA